MKLVFEIICPQSSILVIPLSLTQLFLFPFHLHRKGLRRFNYEFLFSISSASENYGLKLKVRHKIAFERFTWGLAAAHAQNVNCYSTATYGAASLPAAAPHATCLARTTLVPLPNHCVIECSSLLWISPGRPLLGALASLPWGFAVALQPLFLKKIRSG